MNQIPLVSLPLQYKTLKNKIAPLIKRIMANGEFILGEQLRLFEKQFAKYLGVKYCLGVSSGSMALELALKALGVKNGDEVICPTLTFTSTAEAIMHLGATPVFVDIDKNTYNIDKDQIIKNITQKTKVLIIVHLYGQITNMDEICKIAKKFNLKILEDAAQAHGASYRGKKAGSWGTAACFSFYPSKNLGCFGDGGAVVTNNAKIAERIALLRFHGSISKYDHRIVGYNACLDNLQAAVLNVKLSYLDRWNEKRRQIAKFYDKNISNLYTLPFNPPESSHIYYVYALQHPNRDRIIQLLNKNYIATSIHYPIPLHLQKAYSNLKYRKGDLLVSEKICQNIFSIPIYPELTKSEQLYIVKTLNKLTNYV